MKHSLTLIELLTVVVFLGILLFINIPAQNHADNFWVQQYEVDNAQKLQCQKL